MLGIIETVLMDLGWRLHFYRGRINLSQAIINPEKTRTMHTLDRYGHLKTTGFASFGLQNDILTNAQLSNLLGILHKATAGKV